MGGNSVCTICGNFANTKCTCTTPPEAFCFACSGVHMAKGGAHTFVPANSELTSPDQVAEYNARLKHAHALKGQLEQIATCLQSEKEQLPKAIADFLVAQREVLEQVCQGALNEVAALYANIERTIEVIRSDLDKCLVSLSGEFAEETLSFASCAGHLTLGTVSIYQAREELSRRVEVTWKPCAPSSLAQVLAKWGAQSCTCPQCSEMLRTLFPGSPTLRLTPRHMSWPGQAVSARQWSCTHCSAQNQPPSRICSNCGEVKVSASDPWSCLFCSRSNAPGATACCGCHNKPGLKVYLIKKGVLLSSDSRQWKCFKCQHLSPLAKDTCIQCRSVNSLIRDAINRIS